MIPYAIHWICQLAAHLANNIKIKIITMSNRQCIALPIWLCGDNMANCNMGMGRLVSETTIFKRKFRWKLTIDEIAGITTEDGIDALVPFKSARPDVEFKDIEVQHVIEDVFLPGKPNWKPLNLTLYDTCKPYAYNHPVWNWILQVYDPKNAKYFAIMDYNVKKDVRLSLLDGCGKILESWVFENAYPSQVNFQDLDMTSSEVVTCDLTLKYDRAYLADILY